MTQTPPDGPNDRPPDPLPGVPREAFRPGGVLALAMVASFLVANDSYAMGVSALALQEGRWFTLVTHMFAHDGWIHLAFNCLITFFLSGPIFIRMGTGAMAWVRFMLFYLACGLAGAFAYVALNPDGFVPAIGASGAVFGMIGLMARLPTPGRGGPDGALDGYGVRPLSADLLGRNLLLIGLLTLPGLLAPGFMAIAWEAHLGGFLFGLFAGTLFLARRS